MPASISSAAFLAELPPFTHLTAFSLLRGFKWEQFRQAARHQAAQGRHQLLTAPAADLPARRAYLEQLRRYHGLEQDLLTNELREAYHLTATPVGTLSCAHPAIRQLEKLLSQPVRQVPQWMCGPVYQDALAFYKNEQLISVLNVCFSCKRMQLHTGQLVHADEQVYPALRRWLHQLGYPLSPDELR